MVETTHTIPGIDLIELLGTGYTVFWGLSVILIIILATILWRSKSDRFTANLRTLLFFGVGVWAIGLVGAELPRLSQHAMIAAQPTSGFHPSIIAFSEASHSARTMLAHSLLAFASMVGAFVGLAAKNSRTGA